MGFCVLNTAMQVRVALLARNQSVFSVSLVMHVYRRRVLRSCSMLCCRVRRLLHELMITPCSIMKTQLPRHCRHPLYFLCLQVPVIVEKSKHLIVLMRSQLSEFPTRLILGCNRRSRRVYESL
jgi:hypothetical protein